MVEKPYVSLSSFLDSCNITIKSNTDGSVDLNFGTAEAFISLPRDVARKLASELEAVLKEEDRS